MNTEQLKTCLTKEEIFKQAARKNFIAEAQPNISIEEIEKDFDEMTSSDDPEEIFVLKTITTAMQDFASQESKRAVDEFKEKLEKDLEDAKDSFEGDQAITSTYERVIDLIKKL